MTKGGDLVAPARPVVDPTRTVVAEALFLVGTRLTTDLEGVEWSGGSGGVDWSGSGGDDPDPDPDPGWMLLTLDSGDDESGACRGWRGQAGSGFWKTAMGRGRVVAVAAISEAAAISPGGGGVELLLWLGGDGLSPGEKGGLIPARVGGGIPVGGGLILVDGGGGNPVGGGGLHMERSLEEDNLGLSLGLGQRESWALGLVVGPDEKVNGIFVWAAGLGGAKGIRMVKKGMMKRVSKKLWSSFEKSVIIQVQGTEAPALGE